MSAEVFTVEVRVAAGPWIRCADRLPEYGVEVIGAWCVDAEEDTWEMLVTSRTESGEWLRDEGDLEPETVTHWAALASPKGAR